jgi:hypothetical protein
MIKTATATTATAAATTMTTIIVNRHNLHRYLGLRDRGGGRVEKIV